jgi:hypothetical protein
MPTIQAYKSDAEIEAVVRGFEDCTTPKEDFRHRQHLTVAAWYLRHDDSTALDLMRVGLMRFLQHHNVPAGKYQEELTASWLKRVRETIAECPPTFSSLEVTNHVIEQLGDSSLVPQKDQ